VRYYLEQRDPEFEPKMAEILCVYRQVAVMRCQAESGKNQGQDSGGWSLAIVSYDEKPGIQAIATTAPDRPPLPGVSPTVMRDQYKRHGTLTLMAGIDRLTGHVHALIKERHRSREFIEFLKLLGRAYPGDPAIEVILDNHSAHVSRETTSWLAAQPIGRFTFTFTPTQGSGLNLIEGVSSPSWRVRCCATSAWLPNTNSGSACWPSLPTSIASASQSSTLGTTKSTTLRDSHRCVILETSY
jgi:transposase